MSYVKAEELIQICEETRDLVKTMAKCSDTEDARQIFMGKAICYEQMIRLIQGMEMIEIEPLETLGNGSVQTNLFDIEEIHENCTVQILKNSMTGQISIGWWKT